MHPSLLAHYDQHDAHTRAMIRQYGVYIQYVTDDPEVHDEAFAYTVGLFGIGHPELVMVGVCPHVAHDVLNELFDRVARGRDLWLGELVEVESWDYRLVVEQLPNPGEVLFTANDFYRRPAEFSVPAFQLAFHDDAGRFPWEPGYDHEAFPQPRPGSYRG